jgi:hypothetical protein
LRHVRVIHSGMVKLAVFVWVLIAVAAPAAAQSGGPGKPSKEDRKATASIQMPMIFYLARGEPDSCGTGCSEWIVAEGRIDESSAQGLRSLLSRSRKANLPILFDSKGGLGTTAVEIGRILRGREMTAGVYQTIPAGCMGASEQTCRALKQSGQVLPATLRNFAHCDSACVFALIGAKVRQVPPGARVGIHSVKLVIDWGDSRNPRYSDKQMAGYERIRLAEIHSRYRRYMKEMNIDVRLFDLSLQVPHESIRYLSRDEIVAFGVDRREFQETRWYPLELGSPELWGVKFFVQGTATGPKELHTSYVRISCQNPQRVGITYFRYAASEEPRGEISMKFAAGDRSATLSKFGSVVKANAVEIGGSYITWGAVSSFEFLEAAAARDKIEIAEPGDADAEPRITTLSTTGLSQTIAALRQRCGTKSG